MRSCRPQDHLLGPPPAHRSDDENKHSAASPLQSSTRSAAQSARAKIVGAVPFRCPSLAPPVLKAAPSSETRDTCHVRRNLSTRVKFFFHAERSGNMVKSAFGAVRNAPNGDDERFIKCFAQGKWQVRTCAPDAPDADRVRLRVLGHGAPAPLAPPWRPTTSHLSTFQKSAI